MKGQNRGQNQSWDSESGFRVKFRGWDSESKAGSGFRVKIGVNIQDQKSQFTSNDSQVTIHKKQSTSYNIHITIYKLQFRIYN